MYNLHKASNASFGQFWYGNSTNFPGFLYKKNIGSCGKKSTRMGPGGTSNIGVHFDNKYKPGGGGVGASSVSTRRAKNRLATVCNAEGQPKCFSYYNTLGVYNPRLYGSMII